MKHYFAVIHKGEDSAYGVVFPDLPGCLSAGDTYDGAIQNAAEALRRYAESTNGDMPEPRSFEELIADKNVRKKSGNAAFVGIPLLIEEGQTVRINITMDAGVFHAIDQSAQDTDI